MLDVCQELRRVRCPIEKALASSTRPRRGLVLLERFFDRTSRRGGAAPFVLIGFRRGRPSGPFRTFFRSKHFLRNANGSNSMDD